MCDARNFFALALRNVFVVTRTGPAAPVRFEVKNLLALASCMTLRTLQKLCPGNTKGVRKRATSGPKAPLATPKPKAKMAQNGSKNDPKTTSANFSKMEGWTPHLDLAQKAQICYKTNGFFTFAPPPGHLG